MTSLKQIAANRLNARRSTGPRTETGKQRSRQNAICHGLTAETVIAALENAADYEAFEADIASDYNPRSRTERELVLRLASLLWRLRRSTSIETGLFHIEGQLLREQSADSRRRRPPPPEWHDDVDTTVPIVTSPSLQRSDRDETSNEDSAAAQDLASCFIRVSRLGHGTFELLSRYETALWRQAAQLLFMLQTASRR
jgi:hypothetical protein